MSCGVSLADGDYIWERRMVRERKERCWRKRRKKMWMRLWMFGGEKNRSKAASFTGTHCFRRERILKGEKQYIHNFVSPL